jgi:hypothetical protein
MDKHKPNITAKDIKEFKEFKEIEDKMKDIPDDILSQVCSVSLLPVTNILKLSIKYPPKDVLLPNNPISITDTDSRVLIVFKSCMFEVHKFNKDYKLNYRFINENKK